MAAIEAIYERGVFRPLQPVELPEGARVAVTTPDQVPAPGELPEPLVGEELMALLKDLDSLPLEAAADSDLLTTYRAILYPRKE